MTISDVTWSEEHASVKYFPWKVIIRSLNDESKWKKIYMQLDFFLINNKQSCLDKYVEKIGAINFKKFKMGIFYFTRSGIP